MLNKFEIFHKNNLVNEPFILENVSNLAPNIIAKFSC